MESFHTVISQCYPNLKIDSAYLHSSDEGQYNHVLSAETADGPLIFRFPRNVIGVATLNNELRILGRLQNQTTLPIPNPFYTSQNTTTPGQVFMGYPKLPGLPLLREHFKTAADHDTLKKWAIQMVQFLVELHSIPIADFSDLPTNETPAEFQTLYAEIRQYLFPFMSKRAKVETADHFENYLDNPTSQNYLTTLRHGDFGTSNTLYDPVTFDLTGVIDFGFSGLGDPAIDIAALSTLNDTFFGFVQERYPNIELLLSRARFYKGTFLLYEALYGLKSGDDQIFQEAIAPYT